MPSSLRITKLKAYTGEVKIIYNRNITEVINYSKENSNLILIDAKKNGKTGLKVLPPLICHNDDGSYTDEVLKMFER